MTAERHLFILTCVALLAPGALFAADPIDPDNPSEGRFMDDWAEVYMAGGKVGYAHSTMNRDGDLIHTRAETVMKIGRVDQPVKIATTQSTTETLDGKPVSFASEMDASVMKTATRGSVKGGKVTIVSSQFGVEQTQSFDYPAGALMTWGLLKESLRRGFKPGTEYTLATYSPDLRLDGSISAITKVGDWETYTHAGQSRRGQRVSVTMESPMGTVEMKTWVDETGRVLKAVVPAPGIGDLEIVTSSEAAALADFVPPEMFMKTVIKANRKIDRQKASRVTYRVSATSADADLADLPVTDMQEVSPQPDGSVKLTLTRQIHQSGAAGTRHTPLDKAALAEYLESNLMISTKDPELTKLATKAAGGEKEPFALADKLRRFVSDYVATKNLNIGFATASEVCRTREGDCSEHGVLLAALGRINGLPSRVAVGVAYVPIFGNQDDIFGYHLWTQFYIDGRWIDVDAALAESVCSPTRIAFATSSLKNSGLAELSLPLISRIGVIDIDVLEVEEGPQGQD